MNTKLWYMYRDASNYKEHDFVILSGEFTPEQREYLEQVEEFIPMEVGLESLQERLGEFGEDDHVFHEISELEPTDEEPTDKRTVSEFLDELKKAPCDMCATLWRHK